MGELRRRKVEEGRLLARAPMPVIGDVVEIYLPNLTLTKIHWSTLARVITSPDAGGVFRAEWGDREKRGVLSYEVEPEENPRRTTGVQIFWRWPQHG